MKRSTNQRRMYIWTLIKLEVRHRNKTIKMVLVIVPLNKLINQNRGIKLSPKNSDRSTTNFRKSRMPQTPSIIA